MAHLGMHRAGIDRAIVPVGHGVVFAALRIRLLRTMCMTMVGVVVAGMIVVCMSVMPMIRGFALGRQEHTAFRARSFFGAAHLGVHRTGIDRARIPLRHCIVTVLGVVGFCQAAFVDVHLVSFRSLSRARDAGLCSVKDHAIDVESGIDM